MAELVTGCEIVYNSRLLLGVSDLAVETVFRTVDEFVTPWVNWHSGQPSGTAGQADGLDDRVTRAVNGKRHDGSVTGSYKFYCEGNRYCMEHAELLR